VARTDSGSADWNRERENGESMSYRGVRQPVTETGPDGETTIVPYREWLQQLVAGLRAGDHLATDLVKWENEYFAWTREAQGDQKSIA
jgi:hypothetical protein